MSQLQKLIQDVDKAPTARDAMLLAQGRWVKNYFITTGKKDGEQRFQAELLNLLDKVADKPEMARASKFEFFKALMYISRTGLSLASEGHLYIEVYTDKNDSVKIKVTRGNHGKREMLRLMKNIKDVSAGHVVMKGDKFEYDELNRRVIEHKLTEKSSTRNNIEDVVAAYTRVEYKDGRIVDVKLMQSELLAAKKKSKNKRDDSAWAEFPLEMCKKVTYGRAFKELYRDPEGLELPVGGDDEDDDTTDTTYADVSEQPELQEQPAQEEEIPVQQAEIVPDKKKDGNLGAFV